MESLPLEAPTTDSSQTDPAGRGIPQILGSMSDLRFDPTNITTKSILNDETDTNTFQDSELKQEGLLCQTCGEAFSTRASLDTHVRLHHITKEQQYLDKPKAKDIFNADDDDEFCDNVTQDNISHESKNILTTGDKERPYKCGICSKSFRRLHRAKSHARSHSGQKPFMCSFCSKIFTSSDNLYRHIKSMHDGESSMDRGQTPKPDEVEVIESDDDNEFESHTIVINIQDSVGSTYTFPVQQSGANELFRHTPSRNDVSINDPNTYYFDLKTSEITSAKQMAMQMFRDDPRSLLNLEHQQMNSFENRKVVYTGNKEYPFKCRVCSKSFRRLYRAKSHARSHSGLKPFMCPFCSKLFGSSDNLYRHVKKMHKGEAPVKKMQKLITKGKIQDKSVTKKPVRAGKRNSISTDNRAIFDENTPMDSSLRISLNPPTRQKEPSVQSGDECQEVGIQQEQGSSATPKSTGTHSNSNSSCTCEICGKEFKRESYLKRHMICHRDEKPFKCSLCPKAFNRQYRLNNHWRTHTGEKPYVCSVCNKTFAVSDNMYKHIRKMHQGQGIECASSLVKQVQELNREKKYAHIFGYDVKEEPEER